MAMAPINFKSRIQRAQELLGDDVLIQFSYPEAVRNSSVHHGWRQESLLYYFTGFAEPAVLVVRGSNMKEPGSVLFVRDKDPHRELWEGRRLGVDQAQKDLAVDEVKSIDSLWTELPKLIGKADRLHYNLGFDPQIDAQMISAIVTHRRTLRRKAFSANIPVVDSNDIAGRLRIQKDAAEIDRMRFAAGITEKAFAEVFRRTHPGMSEKQVYGIIMGQFLEGGADMEAYNTIVAGGENACILHYTENDRELQDRDVLLIDAGAQYQYYASDVTRTFPVGRHFTGEQRALYDVCLSAQAAALTEAKPGSDLVALHNESIRVIVDGLIDIGLLKGKPDELIEKGAFRDFFPHGTSHWIGMDVHDVGIYQVDDKPIPLEPGMYFSVEPGIYVQPYNEDAPEAFRGIGVRIEDDVLITKDGCDILTAAIPKQAAELENRF